MDGAGVNHSNIRYWF